MVYTVKQETFASVTQLWSALLPKCSLDTVFFTPEWQSTWWKQFGVEEDLCLLGAWNDSLLEGLAPLVLNNKTLKFIGDTDLVDYHDFLILDGKEEQVCSSIFGYLEQLDWDTCDLRSVPETSEILSWLPKLAQAQNYRVTIEREDVSPGTQLPANWEQYLDSLTKKNRHELRRKLRRLENSGHVITNTIRDPQYLPDALNDFFSLLRKSRTTKSEFLTPEREVFFQSIAQNLCESGLFSLFFLELDSRRVAATICFDYKKTRFLYNSGYDPEYNRLSVGLILKALCLKDAIEQDMQYFDFLRGAEAYKYDLGGKDTTIYHLLIQR